MTKEIGDNTAYSDDVKDKILGYIKSGISVRKIGMMDDMPEAGIIHEWVYENKAWGQKYAKAKAIACDGLADKIMDNAEEINEKALHGDATMMMVNAGRLLNDTVKYTNAIHAPNKYNKRAFDDKDQPISITIDANVAEAILSKKIK